MSRLLSNMLEEAVEKEQKLEDSSLDWRNPNPLNSVGWFQACFKAKTLNKMIMF